MDRDDGLLSVRCSCRAAICGSCGMKINGQSGLACKTQIGEAQEWAEREGCKRQRVEAAEIVVEPMGNMPVIKDLVTDMESSALGQDPPRHPVAAPRGRPPPSASTSCRRSR